MKVKNDVDPIYIEALEKAAVNLKDVLKTKLGINLNLKTNYYVEHDELKVEILSDNIVKGSKNGFLLALFKEAFLEFKGEEYEGDLIFNYCTLNYVTAKGGKNKIEFVWKLKYQVKKETLLFVTKF